jgi:hypothetical protein
LFHASLMRASYGKPPRHSSWAVLAEDDALLFVPASEPAVSSHSAHLPSLHLLHCTNGINAFRWFHKSSASHEANRASCCYPRSSLAIHSLNRVKGAATHAPPQLLRSGTRYISTKKQRDMVKLAYNAKSEMKARREAAVSLVIGPIRSKRSSLCLHSSTAGDVSNTRGLPARPP